MMITSPTSYMAEIDAPKIKLFGATIPVEASAEKTATAATTTTTTTTTTTKPSKALPCPRCKSTETKFCYFNNYNVNQPRHFCKGCQRYWTAGGTLRNVPFGAGRRKAKIPGQAAAAAAMAGFAGECVLGQSEFKSDKYCFFTIRLHWYIKLFRCAMASDPIIVDISSDEEGDWNGFNDTQIDWISEYLGNDSEAVVSSDDLVILDELSTPQKRNALPVKSKQAFSADQVVDSTDDDCLVLDGDPDALLPKVNAVEGGSDDLLIVGEKGEVACRDFPHPRHDCVKFPFSSTSHARHCDLCHCFVCDVRAPCVYWGTGQLITDHCHSNNKEERWKGQRFRRRTTPAPPAVKNQAAPAVKNQATPALKNQATPAVKNQATPIVMPPRVGTVQSLAPCTSGSVHVQSFSRTSCATPTMLNHSHSYSMGNARGANLLPQYPNRSRPQQVLLRRPTIYNQGSRSGALGPQVVNQSQRFKRVGGHTTALKTVGVYGSSNNNMPSVVGNGKVSKLQERLAGLDSDMATFSNTPQPNSNYSSANFSAYTACPQVAYNPDFPQMNVNAHSTGFVNAPTGTDTNCFSSDCMWPNSTAQNIQHATGNAGVVNGLASMTQAGPPANSQPPTDITDFDVVSWANIFEDLPIDVPSPSVATATVTVSDPLQQTAFPDYEASWNTLAQL
ncbi:hypothetical protein H6P81_012918 [Aristolochia fimbriata]|uniref:Dof-type domain-containing protein n=1 Tax=Aristolochia fimbriata TaxID=158543 RepID=A0AAV7ED56_ARIFI|nr:hypothetical protein H6P81_012918 [Aristolochia fimbriata]